MRARTTVTLALALMTATAACTFGNYDGSGGSAEGGPDGALPPSEASPPLDASPPPKDTGSPPSDGGAEAAAETGPPGLCTDIAAGGKCSDPGNVTCGIGACAVPANVCCNCGSCGSPMSCMGAGPSVACKEAADCPAGQGLSCCLTSAMPPTTQCLPSCVAPSLQLCRHNAECGGQPCTVFTLDAGPMSCQREFCGTVGPDQTQGTALCGCQSLM